MQRADIRDDIVPPKQKLLYLDNEVKCHFYEKTDSILLRYFKNKLLSGQYGLLIWMRHVLF